MEISVGKEFCEIVKGAALGPQPLYIEGQNLNGHIKCAVRTTCTADI